MIDLRSDTVTRPTRGMLAAMNSAPVGDDVFREDPTVNKLEQRLADMFGKEAGLFCPSGTMTNQIAIKAHTQPLQEIICHRLSHIYNYEGGGIAFNSALSMRLLEGNRGFISAQDVLNNINEDDIHKPVTSLVSQENTCNKAGGAVHKMADYRTVYDVCQQNGLKHHLDGARIFNALTTTGETTEDVGRVFDSVSICLSKGLGAPVGSVLVGGKDFITYARRVRKVFGGGMRQAGVIAAAGLYAIDNHIERLQEDHEHARILADTLQEQSYVEDVYPVDSNIVMFRLTADYPAKEFLQKLAENKVYAFDLDPQTIRFVTHLDITKADIEACCNILRSL